MHMFYTSAFSLTTSLLSLHFYTGMGAFLIRTLGKQTYYFCGKRFRFCEEYTFSVGAFLKSVLVCFLLRCNDILQPGLPYFNLTKGVEPVITNVSPFLLQYI